MNYKVYQGTELKQTVTSKTAVMNGLQPNRTYEFSVQLSDTVQPVGGKTRYLHIAYADSSDGKNGFYVGGGRNLLPQSGNLSADYWHITSGGDGQGSINKLDVTLPDSLKSDSMLTILRNTRGNRDWAITTDFNVVEGQIYTFSVYVKLNSSTYVTDPTIQFRMWANNVFMQTWGVLKNGLGLSKTAWKRVSFTAAASNSGSSSPNFGVSGSGSIDLAFPKFEVGKTATPWSPAPSEAHPIYMGTYTDFTQTDSMNSSDYTWDPIRDGDATRDATKKTISVTTRGIRFNIPKTLTVGSTITLRYEEYPLGIVPIGNEPSGMFGGGNKQNLSAKVISTANGSSVVEVAGNVIEVGDRVTPYASFVDGDTFTAQPDGTFALFSEYKALYY